jgi:hydrogenase nickel incorporation protein HypA/HybF
MHELGIAMQLVDIVSDRAAGARIRRVVVSVSVLAAVSPAALQSCFELVSDGTPVAGAALEIVETEALARCRSCQSTALQAGILAYCSCGARDFEWLCEPELKISEMEVI